MFSTTQLDMLEPLVQAYYENGYNYYVVHTNTNLNTNNYNNYNYYDLIFYFSKNPITYSNGKFSFTGAYTKVNAMTRNVSNNDQDSKLERLSISNGSNGSVTVPLYEHIMSNAENSVFMNTIALTEYDNVNNIDYNLGVNDFFIIPVLLSIIIILTWLSSWFGKNYKGVKLE